MVDASNWERGFWQRSFFLLRYNGNFRSIPEAIKASTKRILGKNYIKRKKKYPPDDNWVVFHFRWFFLKKKKQKKPVGKAYFLTKGQKT